MGDLSLKLPPPKVVVPEAPKPSTEKSPPPEKKQPAAPNPYAAESNPKSLRLIQLLGL
jgi:hypothetical protein